MGGRDPLSPFSERGCSHVLVLTPAVIYQEKSHAASPLASKYLAHS